MKHLLTALLLSLHLCATAQEDSLIIPQRNQQVIDTAVFYGRSISPTYQSAVCTEFVIGVLEHFIKLTQQDITNIRINQPRNSLSEVYDQINSGAPEPKGVYHALVSNGKGEPIDDWSKVFPGDFVQFWYPESWGHCGIVSSIDLETRTMMLHSSFPSTNGYGIQQFAIPDYCFFVRLK